MNIPNYITFSRVIITVISALLLCSGLPFTASAATVLFIIAGATDWVDGHIARKYNIVTNLGKFMDALSDKIMVIGMFMVLLGLDLYGPNWMLFAIFCTFLSSAREFFVSGIRMLAANQNIVLAAETLGKYKAAFQMYSIGAIICAYAMRTDFDLDAYRAWTALHALIYYSGLATLAVSTALSAVSGFTYLTRYGYLLKG